MYSCDVSLYGVCLKNLVYLCCICLDGDNIYI